MERFIAAWTNGRRLSPAAGEFASEGRWNGDTQHHERHAVDSRTVSSECGDERDRPDGEDPDDGRNAVRARPVRSGRIGGHVRWHQGVVSGQSSRIPVSDRSQGDGRSFLPCSSVSTWSTSTQSIASRDRVRDVVIRPVHRRGRGHDRAGHDRRVCSRSKRSPPTRRCRYRWRGGRQYGGRRPHRRLPPTHPATKTVANVWWCG